MSGQIHQSSASTCSYTTAYHTTVNGALQPQREVQAYFKTSYYRPTRQQFLGNTEKLVKRIPFREPSLLYVKRHKLPIQDIHKDPTKESKTRQTQRKGQKIQKKIPHPSQDPNFFHVKGGLPHHISNQAAHRSPSKAQSVVIIGVLLRRTTVLIRMGLLGLSLQGTISSHVCQPSRSTLIGANAAGTALIDVHVPSSHRRSGSPCRGAERNLHVHRTTLPDSRGGFAYLTRFCVHSRSRFVSRAVFRPSEKFARAPFSRRCARACSSRSSCCFAFNCPDLCV